MVHCKISALYFIYKGTFKSYILTVLKEQFNWLYQYVSVDDNAVGLPLVKSICIQAFLKKDLCFFGYGHFEGLSVKIFVNLAAEDIGWPVRNVQRTWAVIKIPREFQRTLQVQLSGGTCSLLCCHSMEYDFALPCHTGP